MSWNRLQGREQRRVRKSVGNKEAVVRVGMEQVTEVEDGRKKWCGLEWGKRK